MRFRIEEVETLPDIKDIERTIDANIIKTLRRSQADEEHFLGMGNFASVHTADVGSRNLCYKIFRAKNVQDKSLWSQPPQREKTLQEDFYQFAKSKDFLVRVPKVFGHLKVYSGDEESGKRDEAEVLIMEKIDGHSLEDMMNYKLPPPENFRTEVFMSRLRTFVEMMHAEGKMHHRDLHTGNIMVDINGEPVIIDFGLSVTGLMGEENPYTEDRGTVRAQRGIKDMPQLDKIEEELSNYY